MLAFVVESQEIQDYARVSFDALSRHEIWRAEQEKFFAEVKMADQIVKEVSGRGKEDVMDVDTAVEQPSGSTVEIFQRPNEVRYYTTFKESCGLK